MHHKLLYIHCGDSVSIEQELVWLRMMVQMLRENAALRGYGTAAAHGYAVVSRQGY
jgi:hypothetical protein